MSDKTLAKIAALLRKAESTDNEYEADAFLAAAQRIATAASVDLALARAHSTGMERRAAPTQREIVVGEAGKRGLRTYVELFVAIAQANDVRCDVARNSTRVFAYGFEPDLDAAHALYASLVVQMVRASDEFIKARRYAAERVRRWSPSQRRYVTGPVSPITARLSFQRAYAARIGTRLSEARRHARRDAAAQAARQGAAPTMALALRTKDLELADHYRAHSTARGTWRGSSATAGYSEHASRAGDTAGRRARLGTERAIGGSRRRLER